MPFALAISMQAAPISPSSRTLRSPENLLSQCGMLAHRTVKLPSPIPSGCEVEFINDETLDNKPRSDHGKRGRSYQGTRHQCPPPAPRRYSAGQNGRPDPAIRTRSLERHPPFLLPQRTRVVYLRHFITNGVAVGLRRAGSQKLFAKNYEASTETFRVVEHSRPGAQPRPCGSILAPFEPILQGS